MKPSLNLRRVFVIASVLSLIITYVFLWLQTISDKTLYTGSDYIAFYSAGRIAQQFGYEKIYDLALQQSEEEKILGFDILPNDVNPFVHPAFIVPVLWILANFDYVNSYTVWAIFLLLIFAICAYLSQGLLPEIKPDQKKYILLGTVLFFPSTVSILNGQDSALLLLGGSLWIYGFTKEDDRLAGLGLALTTIRPHIAILLAVPFIFKRRRLWWWFFAGAAVLVVFSVALIGFSGTRSFMSILTVSASGEGYKIHESAMVNIIGFLNRTFSSLNQETIRVTGWGIYFLALLSLVILWLKSSEIQEAHLGTVVIVSLFAAPHLHYHDLTLLLIPFFIALRIGITRKFLTLETATILPLGAALIFLIANITPVLKYSVPYLAMLGLAFWLWKPELLHSLTKKNSTFDTKL